MVFVFVDGWILTLIGSWANILPIMVDKKIQVPATRDTYNQT